MFYFFVVVLLRLVVWVGIPLFLLFVLVGPSRFGRGFGQFWNWLMNRRHDPAAVIQRVVQQYEKQVGVMRTALQQAETTLAQIKKSIQTSDKNIYEQEQEARRAVKGGDEDSARAALAKRQLEELARKTFEAQRAHEQKRVTHIRRRLHLLELQLRQYEIGRSILLSQLAEARTVHEQYTLANHFDPFSAVAQWQQVEGTVKDEAEYARVIEQVLSDTAHMPLNQQPAHLDPAAIETQLASLKNELARNK
jgi:phage shock protein A